MQKAILSGAAPSSIFSSEYIARTHAGPGILKKFFSWCATQDDNKFMWLAISFFGLIGMVLPITAMAILFAGGNSLALWIIACAFNVPVLILNLAAQPSKIVLSALTLAVLVDVCVIAVSLVVFAI
ncbi:MAG TPA: hypothetical protein VEV83_02510 [Parafilimonas sp.]|nr:hypothetical protein [Parafilimonas sp.]